MQAAARDARGQWLLFVDADCRQAPHSVQAAVDFLAREGGDMLSLWPMLEMHGFWENAVQPVAGSVLVAWFRPAWVNNPKHWAAFANGQYILFRRSAFEEVGGYEAVRTEIVEDIALARLVKRSGRRLLNAIGKDLFTTRMYTTLPQMAKGWRRIYYGAFKSPAWLTGVIALTFLFTLLPFLTLAHASLEMALDEPAPWLVAEWALSLGILGLLFITMRRYLVMARANPWYLLFYPLAVVLVMGFQFGALLRALGFGTVTWRGTTYKGNKVVAGAGGQGADGPGGE
jgi:cellulose synthase/poly-beta-1,6-N-acetylglucosamine synthase-like glycosyltransferase